MLETVLIDLKNEIAALNEKLAKLVVAAGAPPAAEAPTPPPAAEAPTPPPAAEAPTPPPAAALRPRAQKLIKDLFATRGVSALELFMQQIGFARVSDIPDERLADVIQQAEAALSMQRAQGDVWA